MKKLSTLAIGILLFLFSCKDPYKPDLVSATSSFLVVEGVMAAGNQPTKIRLSRTFMLEDTARLRFETNASVVVESDQGDVVQLYMQQPGEYYSPGLNLQMNKEYRLRIRTTNGDEFESDFVKPQTAAVIDSIGWKLNETGLTMYVNSNDPTAESPYYMWEYGETFEIRSYYFSYYIYEDKTVRERRLPEEQISQCWKYDSSKNIILGSTARLATNSLFEAPIAFFNIGDEKLAVRYSMLLRQYALTKDAHAYLTLMKKNTEEIGTIFDPQPSDIRGNIRCLTRPNDPVIGYAMASTVQEKRKFVSNSEVTPWNYTQYCPPDTIQLVDAVDVFEAGGHIIYETVFNDLFPDIPAYYLASYPPCVDCRGRRGTLTRPSFW